ncbi:hypothetical protein [Streptomyces bambusae]|uniref:Uncharacterized protein n=1 Tax=Streptomyces bambusae TaxID=1550616 RepID=A0ABS6Z3L1_9ACTN|nr:hypothetical protein [Streptomyces bambusae]MBW5482161.1 hypothetical protein [Streptomyces bambusae]
MSEIVVVFELGKPVAGAGGAEPSVVRVHAAPAAPGQATVAGPRTYCGKDTFAMAPAPWRPSDHPGPAWYPEDHAQLVCPACADAMG